MEELWHALMTSGLGHGRYVAHGSDLGAGVTAWLARDQPQAVTGIHLATPGPAVAPKPRTEREDAFAAAVETWTAEIGEKVVAWSSVRSDGTPAFERDQLLATLTLCWVTGTITSSLLPYWAQRHTPGAALPVDDPCAGLHRGKHLRR